MKKSMRQMIAAFLFVASLLSAQAADYTTYLTAQRGFVEVTTLAGILGDADYYYLLTAAENTDYIVGVGHYEAKPDWASEESKALRYKSANTDPVADLSNFFTIERSGSYIGLRNVIYDTDLFQTHDNAGYMYVNTYTDKTLDEWSYLMPTFQNGYWLFENGKYPMSSDAGWKGYMGSWTPGRFAVDEPIALNRTNTTNDPAGHYRLFRIKRTDLMALRLYTTILTTENGFTEVTTTDGLSDDPSQCYLITSAEQPGLFVGVGRYEKKPDWTSEESKALRYRQAGNPVADLSNFFTIERSGSYIGLRNVVYHSDLFQTHDNAGYMYVNTYTDKTLDEWSQLKPTFQDGYWLFESGKYPISSGNWACGYLGPWNKTVANGEPIALNRRNTTDDLAGHYRLWRISRANLFMLMQAVSGDDMTWKITNPSFEQGETGWTLVGKDANGNNEFTAREYGMTGKAGSKLMNAYQWWASSLSVRQTLTDLPCGQYELSGTVASWEGRTVTFQTNAVKTTATGVHADGGIRVKTAVTIGTDGQLTIAAGSTTDWWTEGRVQTDNETQCFFKLDDVQLRCTSLSLDALAVQLPNNDNTQLVPGQWYYYQPDYGTEYQLIGQLSGLVYATDGNVAAASAPVGTAATRTLTLPMGRTYFKTTAANATLRIERKRALQEGTFSAVALNVDGLPNKIATYDLNPDGPGRDGTLKISQYLSSKGYDFIGCSEDFNYNGALMESLTGYSCGTIRNTLSVGDLDYLQLIQGKIHVDTDGLNLLWKDSKISASNESWTGWNDTESTDGNQYVEKGYRHYDVQIDGGPVIDVFILHMDAGDTNATWSRESQWRQLADAINASTHSRAKLIIGDTNSRYTREDVISNFFTRLSTDFTASDVWVEKYRGGIYPTTDMDNLTDQSDVDNYSNYEIVDKIIYINPKAANTVQLTPQAFRIEHDYTYDYVDHDGNTKPLGDHHPVVVTFKYQLSGDEAPASVTLMDDADNSAAIAGAQGVFANVTLQGRTLYRDGCWNTLCLPFNATLTGPLADADAREFNGASFDGSTLWLNFSTESVTSLTAGKPYIVRWPAAANADDVELSDPLFEGVTLTSTSPGSAKGDDNLVTFQGSYSPVSLVALDYTNLFLGAANTLYYPSEVMPIGAFRAYFQLNLPAQASPRNTVLNCGEGELTGISHLFPDVDTSDASTLASDGWYTLDGRRLKGKPTIKGIYLHRGRKILFPL